MMDSVDCMQVMTWLAGTGRYVLLEDMACRFELTLSQAYEVLLSISHSDARYDSRVRRINNHWRRDVLLKVPPSRLNKNLTVARDRHHNAPDNIHHFWLELLRQPKPFQPSAAL